MEHNHYFSKTLRRVLVGIGIVVVALVVFGLGILVGYHNAIFNTKFGMAYFRNFSGMPPGPLGLPAGATAMSGFGVSGKVLEVGTSTIALQDEMQNEQAVAIGPDTVIREGGDTIELAAVAPGDTAVVIGDPSPGGAIRARFIRVFTATSSMPEVK